MIKPNPRRSNSHRRNKLRQQILNQYDTCYLCGKPINKNLNGTTLPGAPEVDEIIPVSRGGNPYDPTNCRLTHRYCNQLKRDHTAQYAQTKLHTQPPILTTHNKTSTW